jgi:TonB family protein
MPSFREADLLGIAWGGHQFLRNLVAAPLLNIFAVAVLRAKEARFSSVKGCFARTMKRAVVLLSLLCFAPGIVKSQIRVHGPVSGVAVYAPSPDYPLTARRNHWTGAGTFRCKLRSDGTVSSVDVMKGTGHEILDQAAIAVLGQWRFKVHGGDLVRVPIRFTMGGVRHRMSGAVISD